MKRFAFAVGLLALGFAAATPARADYAVVRFETGYCQIWWDAARRRGASIGPRSPSRPTGRRPIPPCTPRSPPGPQLKVL